MQHATDRNLRCLQVTLYLSGNSIVELKVLLNRLTDLLCKSDVLLVLSQG